MDTIDLGTSGRRTTRLGYGCSSLMGATGRKESLRLLDAAFDAGIRHFDVAPMYGYGAAEGCLGEFLSRHRGEVTVTTKYGIPPAKNQPLLGLARRVVGPIVKLLPGLKKKLAHAADTFVVTDPKASFTAQEAKASLDRSLTELRSDRIDVWLLHEAEVNDLADDRLLRLLEDSVAAGLIGTFGAGSSADKIPSLVAECPAFCRTLQFEWSILDPSVTQLPGFRMHHRALTENFRSLYARLASQPDLCRRWSKTAGADLGSREALAALMLKASLVLNPESVILFSSKSAAHIAENVRIAEDERLAAPSTRLYNLVQSEGLPEPLPKD